ncbi:hypothetical protein HB364_29900 [Pseudoflavitalea sp. X16]|uniref:DUF3108 domain-containing protein n=1 Tax=Paraflavitalea devenefica TaxID=2716334 RepID=UPI001420BB51|nr:hypothetical protein [Paraflavitalea devenefica]NII29331.1 hypothetical protein [Paraflavitalea devenefica]
MIANNLTYSQSLRALATGLLIVTTTWCKAQTVLVPGEKVLDKKWIRNGTYEMACYASSGGQQVEISSFTIKINSTDKALSVYTALQMTGSDDIWVDTSIADGNTFKPVYRSSFSPAKEMVVNYGKEVTGYYYDKQTKKRHTIKEGGNNAFFDSNTYPYLLGLLPLTTGYKNDLAVYDFKPGNQTNTKKARIEQVKSNLYTSNLTGEHKVWQVNVYEEATKDSYVYYIDKDTRRLWKVEILTQGQQLLLIDKEIDYNPFTTQFDKATTLKLVTTGNSVIIGQAFARDNQNEGMLKGIAIFNINKKQHAQAGTSVILIPYTDFYKEWIKLNDAARKKGRAIPLPKEAAECIKVTTVYDKEGHFEFTNLMPGEYLLYTEFGYEHTSSRTEVVGYTDTYINGMFQGSRANTTTYNVSTNAAAAIKKTITIKADGDKIEVKLKKTL